ncbi:MAG TPA: dihydroneopterin aldolase [Methylomirabilota bacterium]|nr:dihydroneopterin aldolase [Methylomirabilota bacterium]
MSSHRPPGASDKILLEDVRFFGHHGVTEAQQTVGSWFSADVELTLDLAPAALSDDLAAGVNYAEVGRVIVEVGTKERVRLLERLASLLADALLREFPVEGVRLRVRKLSAPMEGLLGTPAVELCRTRTVWRGSS